MTQNLFQVFIGLAAVIALFLVTAWLMRRFAQGPGVGGKHIQLLAAMNLGTREKLLLIEAGGQQLLLGVTSQQISTLHTFDEPAVITNEKPSGSEFSRKLQSLLKRSSLSDPQPHQSAKLDDEIDDQLEIKSQ